MNPFFSVAVTTYDRVDLLRQTLESILNQTFDDFEILVGNDNQTRRVEELFPDLTDPRIRWINHPKNLGYIDNVNHLMRLAGGNYFTSLSDDDIYFPQYLEVMHSAVTDYGSPDVAFSGFTQGIKAPLPGGALERGSIQIFSGKEWLFGYLSKRLPAVGCYGVFAKKFIQSLGGSHPLGTEPFFSPYNDNLLAVQAGLAEKVAYCSEPLLYYRLHAGSPSYSSKSYYAYLSAQKDFLNLAEKVFQEPIHQSSRETYRGLLLNWFIRDYFSVMRRSGRVSIIGIIKYIYFVMANLKSTKHRTPILRLLASNIMTQLSLLI
jgi:glycosyltransferase involved in cell wall biosynthesis